RARSLGPALRAGAGREAHGPARHLFAHGGEFPLSAGLPDRSPRRLPARAEAARGGLRRTVRAGRLVRPGDAGPVDGARDGKPAQREAPPRRDRGGAARAGSGFAGDQLEPMTKVAPAVTRTATSRPPSRPRSSRW